MWGCFVCPLPHTLPPPFSTVHSEAGLSTETYEQKNKRLTGRFLLLIRLHVQQSAPRSAGNVQLH